MTTAIFKNHLHPQWQFPLPLSLKLPISNQAAANNRLSHMSQGPRDSLLRAANASFPIEAEESQDHYRNSASDPRFDLPNLMNEGFRNTRVHPTKNLLMRSWKSILILIYHRKMLLCFLANEPRFATR